MPLYSCLLTPSEIKMLIFIRENKKDLCFWDIVNEFVYITYANVLKTINNMEKRGFLIIYKKKNKRHFFLTKNGKEIADNLIKIKEIMKK